MASPLVKSLSEWLVAVESGDSEKIEAAKGKVWVVCSDQSQFDNTDKFLCDLIHALNNGRISREQLGKFLESINT